MQDDVKATVPKADNVGSNELQQKVDGLVGGDTIKPTNSDVQASEPESFTNPSEVAINDEMSDPKTSDMVDEIVSKEGDEIIAHDDEKLAKSNGPEKTDWKQKVKDFFIRWWENPVARWSTIAGLALLLVAIAVIPPTRYFILNSVGVRGSSSVSILDDSTQQPLKNVQFSINGKNTQSDKDGKATLSHLKLGSNELIVEKRGFATIKKKVTIGWGSNPLGSLKLTPQGTQFILSVTDFLSGKPVSKIEATSGEASALSDEKGLIKLTIEKPEDNIEVSVKAEGYREEKLKFSSTLKDTQKVKMVPAQKHAYVSKRSGKYDVYKIDADGKNEQLVLSGTGLERSDIALISHPTENIVALVSTRDKVYNGEGYLLSTLTIINLNDNTTTRVVQSERVQLINWVGNRLIYVQIVAGTSAGNAKRNRIISYEYKTKASTEIAAANYFNDMQIIGGKLYYAPSASYQTSGNVGLFKTDADGTSKKTILQQEVTNIFRTGYDKFTISEQQGWFDYQLSSGTVTKLSAAPSNPENRVYSESPDTKHNIWIDSRDGKGVLISYDVTAAKESTIKSQGGIKNPVHWLSSNILIYRLNTGQEIADYVVNIDGGDAKKLKDVTSTAGVDNWYYY